MTRSRFSQKSILLRRAYHESQLVPAEAENKGFIYRDEKLRNFRFACMYQR